MSGLEQFDAGYNAQEDRILLRITNKEGEEFRLWLTRRVCASLLTDFKTRTSAYRVESTQADARFAPQPQADAADTAMLAELEQKAAAAEQNFDAPFKPGEKLPLGETGLVVENVNLEPNGKGPGVHALNFHNAAGQGISLGVTVELFNSIFEIVERVVQKADWGLQAATVKIDPAMLQ